MTKLSILQVPFDIRSYEGVGPVWFGMTPDQVHAAIGEPIRQARNRRDEADESWGVVSVRYDGKERTVVEVGLVPPARVFLEETELFSAQDPMRLLMVNDPAPMEYLGFIVFFHLGVTLSGFHDRDPSQEALTAFAPGRWDHLRSAMRPYR
ncbi:MAG: hypothetical protein ABI672_21660 [Vicinamibacteria bacterium]